MINGGARKVDLSEELFSVDDDDGGGGASAPSSSSTPSPEFAAMVGAVSARIERRKAKPKTIAGAVFDRTVSELEAMIATQNWEGVTAKHLVALYEKMHTKCYGVAPAELGPQARYNAMMMAATLTKREFGGDYQRTMEFMRWAWTREIKTEKWRRQNGREDGRRIGVRLMFGGGLVTDYRLALARKNATR